MARLFADDNPLARRQRRTDRLVLGRLLRTAGDDNRLVEEAEAAHPVLVKWADLESRGKLAQMTEVQLQGDFCSQVLGRALGCASITAATGGEHHLEQEFSIPGGGTPDAALGFFKDGQPREPLAVVELKGPAVHLDRSRSNGLTAIEQAWKYLYALPAACRFAVVSNFVAFRLYDRNATPGRYEHFSLQSLRDPEVFRRFYALFHRKGLIETTAGQPPRTVELIRRTNETQEEVGDTLYEGYSRNRTKLVTHLFRDHGQPLDEAIENAQRLLDRIIFIAFCEDRGLLPPRTIRTAYASLPGFSAVQNPRWQNSKSLFRFVDGGSPAHGIPAFNGGLFAPHPVDDLELDDAGPWCAFFNQVGGFDFADEVNLDVLGRLCERSITEIEKLKASGLFGGNARRPPRATPRCRSRSGAGTSASTTPRRCSPSASSAAPSTS